MILLAVPLAVSLSIVAMQLTDTMHPPSAGTALIAAAGGEQVSQLGYSYILSPVLPGVLVIALFAKILKYALPRE